MTHLSQTCCTSSPSGSVFSASLTIGASCRPFGRGFTWLCPQVGDETRTEPRIVLKSLAVQAAINYPPAGAAIARGLASVDLSATNMREAFDKVLLEPLSNAPPPRFPMVILLDALVMRKCATVPRCAAPLYLPLLAPRLASISTRATCGGACHIHRACRTRGGRVMAQGTRCSTS